MQGSAISHYRIEWGVRADFNSSGTEDGSATAGFYDVRAIANDNTALTCDTTSPCAFALGAEVQTLDVYSADTNPLTGGQYRLGFTTGEVGSESTTASASCIEFDATAGELETAVGSITGSRVLVARETITDPGVGYRYWVTFVGAAVIGDVRALEITDTAGVNCDPWTVDNGVNAATPTTQHHLSVETQASQTCWMSLKQPRLNALNKHKCPIMRNMYMYLQT